MNHILQVFFAAALMLLVGVGCEKRSPASSRSAAKPPRVASLVPAATDLLIGMGAADHLVAISNYDVDRAESRGLPRVGDYQNFDWEQISAVRPDLMIVFMAPDRMPLGLKQRAEQLRIRLLNVQTERLDDIFRAMNNLGSTVQEPEKAAAAERKLGNQLDSARSRVADRPRPRVLIVRDKAAEGVVGRATFLNDIVEIAGGENAIQGDGWRNIDREMLMFLKPDVILQLLPEASPQVVQEAERFWENLPQLPAVATHRVYILTEWYGQQPGSHVGELALRFADLLHPSSIPATLPSTGPAAGSQQSRP